MLKLHVIQAAFGDSLLLEFGETPKYILIDGGPKDIFDNSLRPEINRIVKNKELEALIISHIDIDHIKGILDLLTELKRQEDAGEDPFIKIKDLWLNTFTATIDPDDEIAPRMQSMQTAAANAAVTMNGVEIALMGVKEGHQMTRLANILGVNLNVPASGGVFTVNNFPNNIVYDNLTFVIVGPTQANLDALKTEWLEWLADREADIADGKFDILSMSDKSIPNLSSIMFLVKSADKTILFTGDGRGDHLLQGLKMKGLLTNGAMHVDVFKVPHHGSDRNSDRSLFEKITAGTYVISADGKDDNPDFATLMWIVESAKTSDRKIRIVVTNQTKSTKRLITDYPPVEWGYKIDFISTGKSSIEL